MRTSAGPRAVFGFDEPTLPPTSLRRSSHHHHAVPLPLPPAADAFPRQAKNLKPPSPRAVNPTKFAASRLSREAPPPLPSFRLAPPPPCGHLFLTGRVEAPVFFKMTKNSRNKKYSSRQLRSSYYLRPFSHCSFKRVGNQESTLAATEKCVWKDAICPVCIEYPHNAVLLLCSSHDNGCRPYVCGTNFHHSNCLDQLIESCRNPNDCDHPGSIELTCPLCRGEVKGYTLVEPAREQLNRNRRSCMQDGCSYVGTYRQLCKHARKKHPSARPRSVDPVHTYRWRQLLFRTALQDMICATSSPTVQGLLSAMLQFEELISSGWVGDDDYHGATNGSSSVRMADMDLADL